MARPAREELAGALAFCRVMRDVCLFFRQVLFEAMAWVDPSGRRLKEAVKQLQLLIQRPGADRRPFVCFLRALASVDQRPAARAELRRAASMTLDELTEDALAAKRAA